MKTCPSCHRSYNDETMMFCLDDGTSLVRDTSPGGPPATLVLPSSAADKPGPTVAASPQTTLTYQAGPMHLNRRGFAPGLTAGEPSSRSALPWLLGIAIVIGLSAIIVTLILTLGRGDGSEQGKLSTPSPAQSVNATPQKTEEATPTATIIKATPTPKQDGENGAKSAFGPLMDNTSFQGTNLTYYPRASPDLCQSDCAGNPNCVGFTWIKPGVITLATRRCAI